MLSIPSSTLALTLSPWRIKPESPAEFNTKKKKFIMFSSNSSVVYDERVVEGDSSRKIKDRVFFLDVNPICYEGGNPSLRSFAHWISLFFSQVSLNHPVIAVIFCYVL